MLAFRIKELERKLRDVEVHKEELKRQHEEGLQHYQHMKVLLFCTAYMLGTIYICVLPFGERSLAKSQQKRVKFMHFYHYPRSMIIPSNQRHNLGCYCLTFEETKGPKRTHHCQESNPELLS